MSAFHGIRDISVMRSPVFLALALRLGAYGGAVAARQRARRQPAQPPAPARRQMPSRYDERSPMAGRARTADGAPPATAASLAMLNLELGANWFSYKTVPAGETQ